MHPINRDTIIATVYFVLAVLITGWFIEQKFWYFASPAAILLSNIIAISKWVIQVIAALLLLKDKKWIFIKRLSIACFVSSCMLFAIYPLKYLPVTSWEQFRYTMFLAILVMIVLYYKAVSDTGISKKWFIGWIVCLLASVIMQTEFVFK